MAHFLMRVCSFLLATSAVMAGPVAMTVEPHPDWSNTLKPTGEPGPALPLATDGRTDYRIVLPAKATSQAEKAADELAHWLTVMTEADLPIVRESDAFEPTGREISVGRTRLLDQASIDQKHADLADEGYAVGVEGERLFLFGGRRRGPIYAVSAFLEEDLGCRWYASGTATIPHAPTLICRPVPRTFVPRLLRRDPYYSVAHNTDWSLRNKTASHRAPIPAKWGGYPRFPYHFVHSYNTLMPPDKYFDDHPEYFGLLDGERRPRQLCATNPDVIRIMTEAVLERLRKCPDCAYVDVSPNDWKDYCECDNCTALDNAEGSRMASLLHLVNAVADAVARERPDVYVTTIAYLGTFMPPEILRPRPNVQIVLCTDSHAWDFLFLSVDQTETFQRALEAWSKTDANLMIWDYAIDFFRYMQPTPNMNVVARNMRFFLDHGAIGIIEQGSHGGNFGVDRDQLRAWTWAKQMWNIERKTETLKRDFYFGFYGKAAEPLYAYDQMLERAFTRAYDAWKARHPLPITPDLDEYRATFFPHIVNWSPEAIQQAAALMDQARLLAEGDKELTRRVDHARLPILFLQADQNPGEELKDRRAHLVLLNEFERIARLEGAYFVREAYAGWDLDRNLTLWRGLAQIDPRTVQFQELSNAWKFKPDPDVVGQDQAWYSPGLDDTDWGTVRSDLGHRGWTTQGYPEYEVGYGWYRQTFTVPDNLADLPNLRLFFAGVDEQAEVWLNGQHALSHTQAVVGLSKDFLWRRPFHFDPKRFLKPGPGNVLAVRVHNDLHVGGIYKPVRLVWGTPVMDLHVLDELLRRRQKIRETQEN